jgi:hypothetical protein
MELKLFMVLLGSKAPQRNIEQHDLFFGIATELKHLISKMQAFWPEAGNSLHIDGWREITLVENYKVKIILRSSAPLQEKKRLFFVNLGGYITGKLYPAHRSG